MEEQREVINTKETLAHPNAYEEKTQTEIDKEVARTPTDQSLLIPGLGTRSPYPTAQSRESSIINITSSLIRNRSSHSFGRDLDVLIQ